VTPITPKIRKEFLCPFCDGNADTRKRKREQASTKPQPVQLLREIPDAPPSDVALLETLRLKVLQWAKSHGYLLLSWPDPEQSPLTDDQVEQCLECCSTSITDATFSESYPRYCFAEQRQQVHRYLQMAAMHHIASKRIVSTVVSNGMDPYGNMKATVSGLKSAISRGLVPADSPCAVAFASLNDFSDFVHYNLVVTHDDFRGKSLAKALLLHETIRWCKRGRNRAFVNMALAKRYDDTGKHIIYSVHVASQSLYRSFGYIDVHPKVDSTTGEDRFTKKEADFGRMLANLDTKGSITQVCQSMGIATRNRK
jgi:GNAT superfamily N-acetyltransferase